MKFSTEALGLGALLLIGLLTIQVFLFGYVKSQTGNKEQVSLLFEELESSIGYRGLIHHFKNAVLRPDSTFYIDLAEERGLRAVGIIAELKSQASKLGFSDDGQLLEATRLTIIEYINRLPLVRDGHKANMSVSEIDRLVAVDDSSATLELSEVRAALYGELDRQKSLTIALAGMMQFALAAMITVGFIVLSNQRVELSNQRVELLNDKVLLLKRNLELQRLSAEAASYLRDPISQAVIVSDLLAGDQDSTSKGNRKLHGLLQQISEEMLFRVTSLFECVRTENVSAEKKTLFDMKDLVSEAVDSIKKRYGPHQTVVIGDLPNGPADRDLFKFVWESLIENAIRFAKSGTEANVLIHGWIHEDFVVYAIKDRGVSIDSARAKALFDLEDAQDAENDTIGSRAWLEAGNGIGLALVKSIVERHGGKIILDREYVGGTCFNVTLPLTATA